MNIQHQSALLSICDQLNLSRLQCYIRMEKATKLPAFTGSTIHGLLGHGLKAADPALYQLFYGEFGKERDDEQNKTPPKPYAIVPSNIYQTQWLAGEILKFEIKLFGQTTAFVPQVIQALQMGQQMGFGINEVPYTLLQINEITPYGEQSFSGGIPLGYRMKERLKSLSGLRLNTGLNILLQTPLRLKKAGKFNPKLPELHRLLLQIEKRLAEIMYYWQDDSKDILPDLEAIEPKNVQHYFNDHTFVQEWSRYSKKEQHLLGFDGLGGSFSLHGDVASLLPWFVIAEQLQIGGKTTFGLGQILLV